MAHLLYKNKLVFKNNKDKHVSGHTTPCYIFVFFFIADPPPFISTFLPRHPCVQIAELVTPASLTSMTSYIALLQVFDLGEPADGTGYSPHCSELAKATPVIETSSSFLAVLLACLAILLGTSDQSVESRFNSD